jgi:serine/arginine repetitive matrix protein 2
VRKKATPAAKHNASPEKYVSSTTSKKGRGRRKTLTPEEFLIHSEEDSVIPSAGPGETEEENGANVLAPRDINAVPTEPDFSTIRTTTTVWNDDPDVLLHKFTPTKKTPTKTGWSSPDSSQAIPKSIPSDSRPAYHSPNVASTEDSHQPSASDIQSSNDDEVEEHVYEEEGEDGMVELQEFDTILESEGFSMISVESVPSLREHLSSPVAPEQTEEKDASIGPGVNILRFKNMSQLAPDDSFSSIAPKILEAATPGKKAPNPRLLAVRSGNTSTMADSFSSIPSEILDAATPGKAVPNNRLLSVKTNQARVDDDSFSDIPSAILEAASPEKHCQTNPSSVKTQSSTKTDKALMPPPPTSALAPSPALESQTQNNWIFMISDNVSSPPLGNRTQNSSRLLTPDDTPSPIEPTATLEDHSRLDGHRESGSGARQPTGNSSILSQMQSSPPALAPRRFTYTAHLRQQRALYPHITETPSIVFSSPSLPPLLQQPPVNRGQTTNRRDSNQSKPPSLSPIVRAGRVLQDIAAPSSTRSRTQSLGSPFKSQPVQRLPDDKSKDAAVFNRPREPLQKAFEKRKTREADIFGGFSDDTRRELRKSLMLGEELAQSHQPTNKVTSRPTSAQAEDPFSSGAHQLRSPSPEDQEMYTLEVPKPQLLAKASFERPSSSRGATVRSESAMSSRPGTGRSESAMSWQPEQTISLDNDIHVHRAHLPEEASFHETTELMQRHREAEWERERKAVSSQIESASTSQVIVISSDVDDEEDIWQAEARHSSSSLIEESSQKAPVQPENVEKPRRSKIPSPWRKNSKRLVYSDELAQLSSPPRSEKEKTIPHQEVSRTESKPAQITVRKRTSPFEVADEQELSEASVMWHIPQKQNFTPRPRANGNLDLSALLGTSPAKQMPTLTSSAKNSSASRHVQQGLLTPERERSMPLYPFLDKSTQTPSAHSPQSVYATPTSGTYSEDEEEESEEISEEVEEEFTEEVSGETEEEYSEEFSQVSDNSVLHSTAHYPSLPREPSSSPQKSCLRTPASPSPTKSVTFVSPTPSPVPVQLSGTEWSKAHWKLLNAIYQNYKNKGLWRPAKSSDIEEDFDLSDNLGSSEDSGIGPTSTAGKELQWLLGWKCTVQGYDVKLEQWHLNVMQEFIAEVPGWEAKYLTKRVVGLMVGEWMRRDGKVERGH